VVAEVPLPDAPDHIANRSNSAFALVAPAVAEAVAVLRFPLFPLYNMNVQCTEKSLSIDILRRSTTKGLVVFVKHTILALYLASMVAESHAYRPDESVLD